MRKDLKERARDSLSDLSCRADQDVSLRYVFNDLSDYIHELEKEVSELRSK